MSSRDILFVVEAAATVHFRLASAAALASRLKARLSGLFATGYPIASAYGDVGGWMQIVDAYLAAQRREADEAEASFRQELARAQLDGDWLYHETDLTRGVVDLARLYDLIVINQHDPDAASRGAPALRPEEVVLASGRPVLILPYAGEFGDVGRRVLVAWNGSREATRALHDSLFLIDGAEAVTVVEIDAAPADERTLAYGAEKVAEFLSRRGLPAQGESMSSADVPVPDLILSRAADLGADLVVMGAYGHSRMREWVLGGASRGVFQTMTVPVLMAH
ncbi:MAG: universal stress protein [Alphaproteobacteria bacterium]|nr:universal stress protein [Alphaproteobacteria bacterium]